MKIVLNNCTLLFNRRDYDWLELNVTSSMFTNGQYILVGTKNMNYSYYGCAVANQAWCGNIGVDKYIDVSNYKLLKFRIVCVDAVNSTSPGYCLYDDYINVAYSSGNTVRSHIVKSDVITDELVGDDNTREITVEVPATAKSLRLSLPANWTDTHEIKVYGVLRDNT